MEEARACDIWLNSVQKIRTNISDILVETKAKFYHK